jgi:hypothetical protein
VYGHRIHGDINGGSGAGFDGLGHIAGGYRNGLIRFDIVCMPAFFHGLHGFINHLGGSELIRGRFVFFAAATRQEKGPRKGHD